MKFIFVDAENIGLKEVEKIQASVIDKVFVFSKSDAAKAHCEKYLYLFLSDYPSGNNQADFYIIASLARALSLLDKKQLSVINIELYSNDSNLISAFDFQCKLVGAKCIVNKTNENVVVPLLQNASSIQSLTPTEEKLYKLLKSPKSLNEEFQKQTGLSQADLSKAINALRNLKLIARDPGNTKKWVRC
ncbi:hypothetical protein NMD15_07025 [Plesiomonas shigelloides]|uniref:hypothetical protein n=1 Tax=Plesiomonas shigelloides TaxID=703 RepID=UPI00351D2997